MKFVSSFLIGYFFATLGAAWQGWMGWLVGVLMALIIITVETIEDYVSENRGSKHSEEKE